MQSLQPHHINATNKDLSGNNGLGRYVFLTGSDARASQISEYFNQKTILKHPRQHNLYLGTLPGEAGSIDVAAISTGMGGPSADIIINELIILGGRRFLRVGTAGSMQPDRIRVGDIVIATGAVRDDKGTWDYIHKEYPALGSMEYLIAIQRAASHAPSKVNTHFGIVHSKSSLYAREYLFSLMAENEQYMETLRQAGILASEMECAQLFILSSLMSEQLRKKSAASVPILCGCILAIIGDNSSFSEDKNRVDDTILNSIQLSLETVKELDLIDQNKKNLF